MRIEHRRKVAIRASWLDCRSPASRDERHRVLVRYNRSLRAHLKRIHLRAENELPDDWHLDALHEEIHGRG